MNRPLFSILHTSARPHAWRAVYDAWMKACANPQDVEYVLVVDPRWGFTDSNVSEWGLTETTRTEFKHKGEQRGEYGERRVVVVNRDRQCYVDGVNAAAKAATGLILIVNADDQFPCDQWDTAIVLEIQGERDIFEEDAQDEFVISVSTGTPDEHQRGIMVMPILSRARYEKLGYVFYPEYESMFADSDFREHAYQDGIVIEARDLMFPHRHAMFDGNGWKQNAKLDAAYQRQNRQEAYQAGWLIIQRRRNTEFGRRPQGKTLAVCISGESFCMEWVLGLMGVKDALQKLGWQVAIYSAYTTNVFVTRSLHLQMMAEGAAAGARPDLVLWIDDDNIVNAEHVVQLLADLDEHPNYSLMAGWCWIVPQGTEGFKVSCGQLAPDSLRWTPFSELIWPKATDLRQIEFTGFPCVLMRYEMLEKLGTKAFLPILDDALTFGMSGEDAAFCKRAVDAGFKMAADPRVKVQHVKLRAVEPVFASALNPAPKVAAMLRVRNESRWITRVIKSLVGLCEDRIFVMDDQSTDDTPFLAREAGAVVYSDPFPGEPLNEARDKAWLTKQVIEDCNPDWILCVDGDEELEPLGAEKILSALRAPQADCYALPFLHLWDRPDQIRCDRWYSTFVRQSLFRASLGLTAWQSNYAAAGVDVHSGLHVGNSPGGNEHIKTGVLGAYLIHYGAMCREDRLRKYEYYNQIDPNNPMEDCYRHIVQGDIPEVPADAVLMHAGPLELRKLPASIAPKFEVVLASQHVGAD